MKEKDRGTLTMEACIVVPVFVILMLFTSGLLILFTGQQVVLHTLVQSTKSMALDPYTTQRISTGDETALAEMFSDLFAARGGDHASADAWFDGEASLEGELADRFEAYLRGDGRDAAKTLETLGVKDGLSGLDFSGSTLKDGVLTVKLTYLQHFPLSTVDIQDFRRELSLTVKLFQYQKTK